MTNREEYVEELKVRLERCNAAIGRSPAGEQLAALREQRERLLARLRAFEAHEEALAVAFVRRYATQSSSERSLP